MKYLTRTLVIPILILITFSDQIYSQQGLKFPELAQRLEPYFAIELINDIKKQLPQGSDYSIWGYDVGDFSGDGYFDAAFTLKLASEKKQIMQVYLFVDIDGFMTKVGQFPYEFVELPLEIGAVIRYNACFITRKRKQFDWLIRGYRYVNGNLIMLDEYETKRLGHLTRETYSNYQSLTNTEKFIRTVSNEEKFYAKYQTIPSYSRGRQIYSGYYNECLVDDIDYVHKGAYYWQGNFDASFSVKSSFDENYLYFTIKVRDESVVIQSCDTCACDYFDIWFDAIPPIIENGDRFVIERTDKSLKFRTNADIGIYKFSIFPGDFLEKKAFVRIGTTDELEAVQKLSARSVRAVATLSDSGFTIKCRIPFNFLGFDENPLSDSKPVEFGCSIVYHDIDNHYRPEEETEIASSVFSSLNPASYGRVVIVPDEMWYGETRNIYKDDIVKILMENGF